MLTPYIQIMTVCSLFPPKLWSDELVAGCESPHPNLFEPIQQLLNHIDFNLKRNSDFINELAKLLETARALKQEAHLKKAAKWREEETAVAKPNLVSVPNSPALPPKERKKSFSLLSLAGKSPRPEKKEMLKAADTNLADSLNQIDSNFRMQLKLQTKVVVLLLLLRIIAFAHVISSIDTYKKHEKWKDT